MSAKDIPIKFAEPFQLESFLVPANIKPYLEGILMPQGMIDSRVEKMAWDIASHYENKPFLMLTVLKGAMHFSSMLSKYLANIYSLGVYKNSIRNEFIKVKSYQNEKSTGSVHISGIEHIPLEGKDVLIIEDIVDSGLTMKALITELEKSKTNSVKICTLIQRKPTSFYDFNINFSGIDCDSQDYFIVGYGLDYNEFFRDLGHLAYLNTYGKEALAKIPNE